MKEFIRTPATVIWAILILATGLSWMLGTDHGLAHDDQSIASVAVLLIAFIKVRFIGLYFMELRDAPKVLRGLFEGYCFIVGALVISLFSLPGW